MEVRDFIKRRSNGESSSCRTLTADSDNDEWLDTTSIRTIFGLKSSKKPGVYTTKAKIINVDADEPWYYELCGNVACLKRVDLGKVIGDTCNKCSAPNWINLDKFRIRILVADHSAQTYFTLVESSAPYSVNKSATKLKKETDEEQVQNFTLAEISKLLVDNYSSLRNFDCMPIPDESIIADVGNMLILEETSYNLDEMCAEHSKLYPLLTGDQRTVYDKIMYAVDKGVGGVFFLYGYNDTGKTFTWRTLCSALRGKGDIVIPVASSGIASLLIPKGRTAHSRFGIPLLVDEKSYCNKIKLGTEMTELLKKTKLIIWDEAPMTHRYCFEALDRSLKDVMRSPDGEPSPKSFGG
ncbi:hypothetical protein OROMI_010123 [Orobanche minor]